MVKMCIRDRLNLVIELMNGLIIIKVKNIILTNVKCLLLVIMTYVPKVCCACDE